MPSSIHIFGLELHLYGLIIGLAIGVGAYVCVLAIRKMHTWGEGRDIQEEWVWQGLWWAVIGGVIGARMYHVIDAWQYYSKNILLIPAIWNGGLGIFGAMAGGIMGLYFFCRRKNVQLVTVLDVVALGLPLGQAIGRWGNYVNQELYGLPTNLPWAIFIAVENRLDDFVEFAWYHPLFLYESLGMLLVFGGLWWGFLRRKLNIGSGMLAALYLVGYGVVRLVLDSLRLETWRVSGLAVAQVVSGGLIIGGLIWWYKTYTARKDVRV